ncbi:cobalt-precorrin-6A reductase [Agrobacterium rubi]|uniref:cobalt-precorrin-6A reductase n=1 Tax=Agrobacterium rubi TaxID=28099 RepID=UPI001571773C|nr:cobalt-precorrin-6A reductase [Agrobacterium rubi]NTF08660.1 cobalt-precorrin-6A reductase [Agrobacterium rubi]NTF20888.1 cobalt-precorrin-6A reductase [Agrobacterium rubi]NTF27787.1 cobalt-precorrin-6A reductase [Agrobacterium rubi]
MTRSILILGGTADARILAGKLADESGYRILLSMAGRTRDPVAQPVPMRSGGFGGASGLARFIEDNAFDLLVDATHPYAARISANAVEAAGIAGVPLVALERPAWVKTPGDDWREVPDVDSAVTALGQESYTAFLALGRQELLPFEAAPQHHYLIRSVDPVEPPLVVPHARYITARGPFALADEVTMLRDNGVEAVVCKNSGGAAAYGKIEAARQLGIPVIMIARPAHPCGDTVSDIDTALSAIRHQLSLLDERGE